MTQTCNQADTDYKDILIDPDNLDSLLEKEWLLTNSRGSYSSGTIIGCNTRRYHGTLIASLHPPVERIVTVANIIEKVTIDGNEYDISSFEFSDRIHPDGYTRLKKFRSDSGVHFYYDLDGIELHKSIYLCYDTDRVIVSYELSEHEGKEVSLNVTPLVVLRDFHALQNSSVPLNVKMENEILTVHHLDPTGPAVHMKMNNSEFEHNSDWWYSMKYRVETFRGQQDYEDLCAIGTYTANLTDNTASLVISASSGMNCTERMNMTLDEVRSKRQKRRDDLYKTAKATTDAEKLLVLAADQVVVRRGINKSQVSTSILAGYHWFADWGRDTFISLPGTLLSTGRYPEAKEVLETFGSVLDRGQIPNRFDDYGNPPHYNSIDASLWFVNAAWQYLQATGDLGLFRKEFRPMLKEIVTAYHDGTRDNIHAEADGLLTGGDEETQLTWMDAKCNGIAFTPRYGKAVEINALWYNALKIMAETASCDKEKNEYEQMAKAAAESFNVKFWNPETSCLYDFIYPDGMPDAAVRPNQIFAVSLPFTCLPENKANSVVSVVKDQLLTPYGLRSLSPLDSRYRGYYGGDQFQRDSSYHQGTVWGWLIGPFIEAFLKVNDFSECSLRQSKEYIAPLIEHARSGGCMGSVAEIFDGDYPHNPKGCIAQAWSVAELLRVTKLINSHKTS